jgi:hypothetical protein
MSSPSVKKFHVLNRNSREIIMSIGALYQSILPTSKRKLLPHLLNIVFQFIFQSTWDSTVSTVTGQWARNDLKQIYLFSTVPTQATLPTHDPIQLVHSVEQKSITWNILSPRTGSDVPYSCHHNSSRFTFPIFTHSYRFSVFPFITINHTIYINLTQQYICLIWK